MDAHEMFDRSNRMMSELDHRFKESEEPSFSAYLRKHPEDRAAMKDIARIREEAHDKLSKELGE